MSINEQMVQDIVQDVLAKMQIASDVQGDRGVFKDMNEAIEAAKASQKIVAKMSLVTERKLSPTSVKRSWRMQKSWPVWEFRRLAWEMSDIKF